MRAGDFSAEQYAEALLSRCGRCRSLNAFITLEPDQVLIEARQCDLRRRLNRQLGPLHGLPIPVKDSINTCQFPTTAGTSALRHFQPGQDADVVTAIRRAGAIVLGKTNMHELSFGWTSDNRVFGPVRNPYNLAHVSGGSSGGSAAAVAARMAPLSIGEDTEGSIRVPAALCGSVGFRPTTGRYSTAGVVPITPLFDQVGPHARCVRDVALLDSVLSRAHSRAPAPLNSLAGVKLGVCRSYWFNDLDPEVEQITNDALRRLQNAGAEFIETDIPKLAQLIQLTTAAVQSRDFEPSLSRYLQHYKARVSYAQVLAAASEDVRMEILRYASPGGQYFASHATYRAAVDTYIPELRMALRTHFLRTGVLALVFPTTLVPAPLIGDDIATRIDGNAVALDVALGRNVDPGSTAGLPGLVLPAGLTAAGLPVGLEFDGPSHSDRTLLALGEALESALGAISAPSLALNETD